MDTLTRRIFEAATTLGIALPADVLLACVEGARREGIDGLLTGGWLVEEAGCVRANRVRGARWRAGPPPRDEHLLATLTGWIEACEQPGEDALAETVRLCLRLDRGADALRFFERLVTTAVIGMTAGHTVEELDRRGLLDGRLGGLLDRAPERLLLLLVESPRRGEAAPLLAPPMVALRARLLTRSGRPAEALLLAEGSDRRTFETALEAARAALDLGRPDKALAVLPRGDAPTLLADVERASLSARAHSDLGHGPEAEGARGRLLALADREPRVLFHVHYGRAAEAVRLGDLKGVRAGLEHLRAALAGCPASRFLEMAEALEAVGTAYGGRAEHLAAKARSAASPGVAPGRWGLARARDCLARSDFDALDAELAVLAAREAPGTAQLGATRALLAGDPASALAWLERATETSLVPAEEAALLRRRAFRIAGVRPGPRPPARNAWVNAGHLLHDAESAMDRGDLHFATSSLRRARETSIAAGLGGVIGEVLAAEADAAARAGNIVEALRLIERAADHLPHAEAPLSRLLTAATHALRGTRPEVAVLNQWTHLRDFRALALIARQGEVPHTTRAFLEGLDPHVRSLASAAFPRGIPVEALVVTADGTSIRPPGGAWIGVSRRRAACAVLRVLVERRTARPGETVLTGDLFRCGWPGERAVAHSAQNRVYVAVAWLRRVALEGLLQTHGTGYRLDPGTPVMVLPTPFPGAQTG